MKFEILSNIPILLVQTVVNDISIGKKDTFITENKVETEMGKLLNEKIFKNRLTYENYVKVMSVIVKNDSDKNKQKHFSTIEKTYKTGTSVRNLSAWLMFKQFKIDCDIEAKATTIFYLKYSYVHENNIKMNFKWFKLEKHQIHELIMCDTVKDNVELVLNVEIDKLIEEHKEIKDSEVLTPAENIIDITQEGLEGNEETSNNNLVLQVDNNKIESDVKIVTDDLLASIDELLRKDIETIENNKPVESKTPNSKQCGWFYRGR